MDTQYVDIIEATNNLNRCAGHFLRDAGLQSIDSLSASEFFERPLREYEFQGEHIRGRLMERIIDPNHWAVIFMPEPYKNNYVFTLIQTKNDIRKIMEKMYQPPYELIKTN